MTAAQPVGFLSTAQVAAVLGISPDGVRKLKAAGRLTPTAGTPRKPLYPLTAVATYQATVRQKRSA